ncbi:MAG: GNAT family N-acetyltransferase, partial [Actinobacteria bacterium]|nr:GNAT family N-acetyltransferase [Actinomycetota bacterium]
MEESGINAIHPYYFIGLHEGRPVGIAYCFAMDLDLTKLTNKDPPEVLAAVKAWRPGFMRLRLLEVGHLSSLGATVEAVPGMCELFLQALSPALDELARLEGADLGVIRDVPPGRYQEFRVLEAAGYRPALGFPIARLGLGWPSFEGYVGALKHKTRQHLHHRQAVFHAPEITVEVIDDYGPLAERLAELWRQVARRHREYEHERLTPAYFTAMAKNLPGRSHVVAIKRGQTIVAFGLGLIGDDEYFGVAEGMDYSLRDTYGLYPNLFLEVIRVACELGMRTLNFGITTYDFKMSLGAELERVVYLLKAFERPEYSAGYAELFATGISRPVNHHRAFAGQAPSRLEPYEARRIFSPDVSSRDPFLLQHRYVRADLTRVAGVYPFCPVFESAQQPVVRHEGREVIMLGTNSYLGLATDPRVKQAAKTAVERYGSGCSGSPMFNGTLDVHVELARRLARFTEKDDALLFSTGYQT